MLTFFIISAFTFLHVVVGILIQCIFFFFSHTGVLIGKQACFFSIWFIRNQDGVMISKEDGDEDQDSKK